MTTDAISPHVQAHFRGQIMRLQSQIAEELPRAPTKLRHFFAPGVYGREITMYANTYVVGKIHKHAHINVISKGYVVVATEDGVISLKAGDTWISKPGTKRAVVIIEECQWMTIHPNPDNTMDLGEIEEFVIAKSFEDYEQFAALSGSQSFVPLMLEGVPS
jgi:quercetin dioxygenase-like cupin family protein